MNFFVTYSNRDVESHSNRSCDSTSGVAINNLTIDVLKNYHNTDDVEAIVDSIHDAQNNASIKSVFDELNDYAADYFHVAPRLSLEVRDNTVSISQSKDIVYINSVLSSAFFSFVAVQLYRSFLFDNGKGVETDEDLFCYRYTLFILNDMCFNDFRQPTIFPSEESVLLLMERFKDNQHLLDLASDIFYTSVAFALLHEMSHAYLNHDEAEVGIKKELEADAVAYKLFLNFCDDVYQDKIKSNFKECMQPYTYMAPMYLLEFYYIVYYTGSFLCPYHVPAGGEMFQDIVDRKEALQDVFCSWDGGTDETEAYALYNAYLDGEESFLHSFVASDKAGLLDKLKERNSKRYYG